MYLYHTINICVFYNIFHYIYIGYRICHGKYNGFKSIQSIIYGLSRPVYRFANTYVRDIAVAEDFTIEALMYYWENRHSLEDNSNVPAYILTIIKNKCLNYLQHLQVREDVNEHLLNHAEWELNTRISTLEACDPGELFTAEAQEIVNKTLGRFTGTDQDRIYHESLRKQIS